MMILDQRKKRFISILAIFTIIGFGLKWLYSGSVTPNDKPTSSASHQYERVPVSQQDVEKGKHCVKGFIPAYFNQNRDQLKQLSTSRFFSLLNKEIENPLKEPSPQLKRMDKLACGSDKGAIRCFVTVQVLQKSHQKNQLQEHVYDMILVRERKSWLVDEVNLRGAFE